LIVLTDDQIHKLIKKKRVKKTQPFKPPAVAERILRRKLMLLWEKVVFPSIQKIKAAIDSGMDLDELSKIIDSELYFAQIAYDAERQQIVDMWSLAIEKETRQKLQQVLANSLGVDIAAIVDEPVIKQAIEMGTKEASELITGMPTDTIEQIRGAVLDNFKGVALPENRSLLKHLSTIAEISQNRAKMIARDQTKKLTSLINQTRQQKIGVTKYIWKTVKDERVVGNPSGRYPKPTPQHGDHYIMEGLTCLWDDASVYSDDNGKTWKKRVPGMPKNHPGDDIL
jgi:uncharacterized protein with gpF-like domain